MPLPYFLNPANYLKIFYRPHKLLPTLRFKYRKWYERKHDVKFKAPSVSAILSIHMNALAALERMNSRYNPDILKIQTLEEYLVTDYHEHADCNAFGELFTYHGSDKASTHNYFRIYYHLLKDRKNEPLLIFEVGLGTNYIDIQANMGLGGKPGASLRTFRDFLPNAVLYGGDIDKRILFSEDRITTFFMDQADPKVLAGLKKTLPDKKFDLIIDDGWHVAQANMNTIEWGLDLLNQNGILVVEDIHINDYSYYQFLYLLIQKDFRLDFIRDKAACLVIITKKE